MTQHLHRLFACVPDSMREQANNWIRNNLDPEGGDWLSVPISATGSEPATYWGFDAALTPAQLRALVRRLLQFTDLDLPEDWDQRTLSRIRNYAKNTLLTRLWKDAPAGKKIGVLYVANDGDWAEHQIDEALARVNLKRVVAAGPGEGQ